VPLFSSTYYSRKSRGAALWSSRILFLPLPLHFRGHPPNESPLPQTHEHASVVLKVTRDHNQVSGTERIRLGEIEARKRARIRVLCLRMNFNKFNGRIDHRRHISSTAFFFLFFFFLLVLLGVWTSP